MDPAMGVNSPKRKTAIEDLPTFQKNAITTQAAPLVAEHHNEKAPRHFSSTP